MDAERAEALAQRVLEGPLREAGADEELAEYAVGAAASALEEALEDGGGEDEAREALADAVEPILEGAELANAADLCAELARLAVRGEDGDDGGANGSAAEANPNVLDLRNIILMFGGRVLLKRSDFVLRRGGVYALIGRNGVGKTTLLTRLAARDINGFPPAVSCAYVQHEVQSDRDVTVAAYARRKADLLLKEDPLATAVSDDALDDALHEVGFDEGAGTPDMDMKVAELSGGWRMRLALALAVARKADVLMLDEPTNHLDVEAVAWLVEWIKSLEDTTVLIVSHDVPFMSKTVDNVIHFHDLTLDFHEKPFAQFHAEKPDAQEGIEGATGGGGGGAHGMSTMSREDQMAERDTPVFKFPHPGPLDGIKRRTQPVVKLTGVTFQYEGASKASLKNATVRLPLGARVAIVGPNGAGKSTLLKLMVAELELVSGARGACRGEIWRHTSLRVAYVAQHSMHHLEKQMDETPVGYIIRRYGRGVDKEALNKVAAKLTEDEEAMRTRPGQVSAVVGRRMTAGLLMYELTKAGRPEDRTDWEPVVSIERMPAYVMKLCRGYDETMKVRGRARPRAHSGAPSTQPQLTRALCTHRMALSSAHAHVAGPGHPRRRGGAPSGHQ